MPVGYPMIFDFLPNLDAFYREWLGRPLPYEVEYRDLCYEIIVQWAQEK